MNCKATESVSTSHNRLLSFKVGRTTDCLLITTPESLLFAFKAVKQATHFDCWTAKMI